MSYVTLADLAAALPGPVTGSLIACRSPQAQATGPSLSRGRNSRGGYPGFMDSAFETANRAAAQIEARLGSPPWLRTIGVAKAPRDGGFRVEIGVAELSEAILSAIPTSVDGVEVEVHRVGPIRFARE